MVIVCVIHMTSQKRAWYRGAAIVQQDFFLTAATAACNSSTRKHCSTNLQSAHMDGHYHVAKSRRGRIAEPKE